jgi:hypothetical protein
MFLIFGIKRLKKRLATMLAICGQCTTPAAQVIVRTSTWFSLFFIPVIPLGSKYYSTCTLCGVSVKLDKAQAMEMVAAAQQVSAQPPDAQIPQAERMVPPPPSTAPLEP